MHRFLLVLAVCACSENPAGAGDSDALIAKDADPLDGALPDALETDAGEMDAMPADVERDAGQGDADASTDDADAAGGDADVDASDAGDPDADQPDAEPPEAGDPDAADPDASDAGPADTGAPTGLAALNDEFDDPATLANWTLRDVAEGTPAQYGTLDIDTTQTGHLVIIPDQTSFWGDADRGIYLYKTITGDFIMHVYLRAVQAANPAQPPTLIFNSAGLLARDPASPTVAESWVLTTLGVQASAIGTRVSSTANSNTNMSAYRAATIAEGELVICRIGAVFTIWYTTPNKGGVWTQTDTITRMDLPATLQVGIATDAFAMQPHLRAEIDWIRFALPTQPADCTMNIPPN